MRVGVIGGGWAGLAAAVRAQQAGHRVALFEMAGHLGGRAREVAQDGLVLDNGQHILIGAYARTLDLMKTVGANPATALCRLPLELRYPDGRGLRVPPGPQWLGLLRATGGARGWGWRDRAAFARAALGWVRDGFQCPPERTVQQLCADLTPPVRQLLIDPLCVAALNTPAREASAMVMLRVMRDALFGGPGASDLLLPRRPLTQLLPAPAQAWLQAAGAELHLGTRVNRLARGAGGWHIDDAEFDGVVLACPAAEAARLAEPVDARWARRAAALRYEPIVTVYLRCPGARLPAPMTALFEGPVAPAQFAFDHGALGGTAGLFAFVISGARPWVERGHAAIGSAVLVQAREALRGVGTATAPEIVRVLTEKRATFRCTPALVRPPRAIAPGLVAAGDYVEGPYPATLEGAVRAGEAAAAAFSAPVSAPVSPPVSAPVSAA
jgi:squalene-associated FAD-dependent desaturase